MSLAGMFIALSTIKYIANEGIGVTSSLVFDLSGLAAKLL
jgi:hypothetical protein